mgnify:CR=1 FL=1
MLPATARQYHGAAMAFDLIRVAVFGRDDAEWNGRVHLRGMAPWEATGFALRSWQDDADLERVLVDFRPQVIVTFGATSDYPVLCQAPLDIRRRWVNLPDWDLDPASVAERVIAAYIVNATTPRFAQEPLISVFTPTYLTGAKIERPFRSLLAQHYPNWEWVIYDDSPDDGATFQQMTEIAQRDHRIAVFRGDRHSGCIGEVKRRACGLTRGAILVELDHDDELTPNALLDIVEAHQAFPDAGFFYSDCAEIYESGEVRSHGDDWGLGFGSYREEVYQGRRLLVTNYPDINAKTIRHIVGVPNHYRAWTREAYLAAGGYNTDVHVCDDYEFLLRTFLTTRMVHIRRLGYIQYINNDTSGNTQYHRNAEIQRLVHYFRFQYNQQIHQRLLELGIDDFMWREDGAFDWSIPNPLVVPIANYELGPRREIPLSLVSESETWLAAAPEASPASALATEPDVAPESTRPVLVSTTITGNSADVIGDALRSVADWVDRCLVIDTGITDDTLEIARAVAGDKLVVRAFPWQNDFSAARNYALAAAAELGAEWAFTLDTDERIDPGPVDLRAALAGIAADVILIQHEGGTYGKERLFRLPARGRFVGPTHEAFNREGEVATLPGVVFRELGKSQEAYRRKAERDVLLLAQYTADHRDEPRWFYYLGDSLAGLGRHEEAIAAFRACADLDGWDEEGAWALYRAAESLMILDRPAEAVESCAAGLARHAGIGERYVPAVNRGRHQHIRGRPAVRGPHPDQVR